MLKLHIFISLMPIAQMVKSVLAYRTLWENYISVNIPILSKRIITDPTKYSWTKIKGETGAQGPQGNTEPTGSKR